MGTHPIFESDFDCLTVKMNPNSNPLDSVEFDFERISVEEKRKEDGNKSRNNTRRLPVNGGDDPARRKPSGRKKRQNLSLPKNWLHCPKHGSLVAGFLPFKVPLKRAFDRNVKSAGGDIFGIREILNLEEEFDCKIGMVLDLTYTDRYYDHQSFGKFVDVQKFALEGHGKHPSRRAMENIFVAVDSFREKMGDEAVIGIHCTHGFNRTGFVICSYLVERKGWDVGAAIDHFAKMRQGGIYRENVVNELYRRYAPESIGQEYPDSLIWMNRPEFATPEWHKE